MNLALLLVPDFLLIGSGALLRRLPVFPALFWTGVERLVYFLLFPALLFRALATSALAPGDGGRLVAVVIAFTLGGMALSALGRPVLRLDAPTFAACFQCGFRFNTYIALAIATRLGGEAGVALLSLAIGALVPIVNIAAVSALAQGRGGRIVAELVRNPLILASAAGIGWRLTGWPLPSFALRVLEQLAGAALPLGLLAVGAGLRFGGSALPATAVLWWNGVKLVAMPALALTLVQVIELPPLERSLAVALAAVPTAPSAYILANQMNGRGAPVALLVSTGTLLAAATLPFWLAIVTQ
jgi:predicted permease